MAVEHEYLFNEIWDDWVTQKIDFEDFDQMVENYVVNFVSGQDLKCLDNRKDGRTYGEFFRQVQLKTNKQNNLMLAWSKRMSERGYCVEYKDNGVDNSGKPILSIEKLNKDADYLVSIDNAPFVPVELKEASKNITIKVADLKSFIEQEACILFFWKTGNQKIRKDAKWALFGPATLNSMLSWPHKRYKSSNGGKLSVQIKPKHYDRLFEVYSLFEDFSFLGISNKEMKYDDIH